jgi:hypothetical protein
MGELGGMASVISMANSTAYVSPGIGKSDIKLMTTLDGQGYGGAAIEGPTFAAAGRTVAGGAGSGNNRIKPTTTVIPGASSVAGSIAINTQSDFAGAITPLARIPSPVQSNPAPSNFGPPIQGNFGPNQGNSARSINGVNNFSRVPTPNVSPGLTGGRAGATGVVTVNSFGTGNGPSSVNSVNNGNIFADSQVIAANQLGAAGGLGSGVATAGSLATGATALDLMGVITGTGMATGNFNNAGAGAFANPTTNFGATGNSLVGNTGNLGLGATTSFAPPSFGGSLTLSSGRTNNFSPVSSPSAFRFNP